MPVALMGVALIAALSLSFASLAMGMGTASAFTIYCLTGQLSIAGLLSVQLLRLKRPTL